MRYHVQGMHGFGDSLHQRTIVRHLVNEGHEVWLETSWPQVYHDMPGVIFVHKQTKLRTQSQNAAAHQGAFTRHAVPKDAHQVRVWYSPTTCRAVGGSVLHAMLVDSGFPNISTDFRLPVKPEWRELACRFVDSLADHADHADFDVDKPLMFFRPLHERREWSGCAARNPDYEAYAAVYGALRESFTTVSVGNFKTDVEWLVGPRLDADYSYHRGELSIETIVGLIEHFGMVMASPGFAIVTAQAVGTPSVVVVGGYEGANSFGGGAVYAPHLAIEPIRPCSCFSHAHPCAKAIDMPRALERLKGFVDETASRHRSPSIDRLEGSPTPLHEPG